jgi:hypothetical protein
MGTTDLGQSLTTPSSTKMEALLEEYYTREPSQRNSCTNGVNETQMTAFDTLESETTYF